MSGASIPPIPAEPALIGWLERRGWHISFGPRDIQRGGPYSRNGSIRSIETAKPEDDTVVLKLVAEVSGDRARPYRTSVEVYSYAVSGHPFEVDSECSCPVYSQCKHGAAVMEFLSQHTKQISSAGAPRSSRETRQWLRQLEEAASETQTRPKKNNQFLAYCIEPDAYEKHLVLTLRPGRRMADGRLKVEDREAQADPAKPAVYMREEDIPLTAQYHAYRYSRYEHPRLQGKRWHSIVSEALKLGRLFHAQSVGDFNQVSDHHVLAEGEPATVLAEWREQSDGILHPELRFNQPGLKLLPLDPPRYLDPENHLIGPVQSDLSASLLMAWSNGPPITSEELDTLGDRFATIAPSLPEPNPLPTERLSGIKPRPYLKVCNQEIKSYPPLKTIVGELGFKYGDSPRFHPLSNSDSELASWKNSDTRFVVTRSLKEERALERQLHRFNLTPLHKIFRQNDLKKEQLHHVIVEDANPSLELAWLAFLEHEADSLRKKGWTIEVEPATGLTMHDVDDFSPAIEAETDHGIDWFQFELSVEIDGEKVSLIPFIADLIASGLPPLEDHGMPDQLVFNHATPEDGFVRFPTQRFLEICHNVAHLFHGRDPEDGPLRLDRLSAAGIADALDIKVDATTRALAKLGQNLREITSLPNTKTPSKLQADLRPYQLEGYRWLRFLAKHGLNGILADDMGLGKTVQTLAFLAATRTAKAKGRPALVIAPTSVVTNWAAEAERFTPKLKTLLLHGSDRKNHFGAIPKADLVLTSYPLLNRDHEVLTGQDWHTVILDEAQYIKNPKTASAKHACELTADHRFCLSGTPMENHLGELWSLMRFLMPGFLGNHDHFNQTFRKPIERELCSDTQIALNRRVAPLILRRTKGEVAGDLPPKTELLHRVELSTKERDLYESVRATMDKRVRDAIAAKGLGRSHIIVLEALLKLRQICCHPSLLKTPTAAAVKEGSKLNFLTKELLPTLVDEGRRILLFSQFTSVLKLIEAHLKKARIPHLKLTGQTKNRGDLVKEFQRGDTPVFLISLKAGGTGLNLTAADTVIHYDPWWNPAAENQATDRAHRIGQDKPVFVHKLICTGSIEDRILELQAHKSRLVEALLSEETTKLKLDQETLGHLLAPL